MDELEELDAYNGETDHDMWVDFTYHEDTGELADLFDEDSLDNYIDNLNDWD